MTTGVRRWRLVRAGTDAVPASVRRLMARRPPAGARARPLALAGAVAVLALLVVWTLWSSSLLGVREVRVTGVEVLSVEQVREVAGVTERTPLLRVDLGAVAHRVAGLPPVETVRVRRDWPDTVVIEVTERTAVAVVPGDGGAALVDAHAVIFHTVRQAPADLPRVVLNGSVPVEPTIPKAISVLTELTPQLREELRQLTVTGPAGIRLELHSGRTVVWGDETDSARKAQVATILLDYDGDIIDVSAPEVVSIR